MLLGASMYLLYFEDIPTIIPTDNRNTRNTVSSRNKREKKSRLQKGLGNFSIPYICLNVLITEEQNATEPTICCQDNEYGSSRKQLLRARKEEKSPQSHSV